MYTVSGKQTSRDDLELGTKTLEDNLEFMSPLQSWAPELRNIEVKDDAKCDITFEEPVFITKLDASVNMYHHFCDFFNLYLSLHLNYSLGGTEASAWDTDKRVLLLENSPSGHKSPFSASWSAFTQHPVLELTQMAGKVVCFKKAVFPLLARSEKSWSLINLKFIFQDDIWAILQYSSY